MFKFGRQVKKFETSFSYCMFCQKHHHAVIYVTQILPKNKDLPDKYHSLCIVCKKNYYFSDDEAKRYLNRYTTIEAIIIILKSKIENLFDITLKGFKK